MRRENMVYFLYVMRVNKLGFYLAVVLGALKDILDEKSSPFV